MNDDFLNNLEKAEVIKLQKAYQCVRESMKKVYQMKYFYQNDEEFLGEMLKKELALDFKDLHNEHNLDIGSRLHTNDPIGGYVQMDTNKTLDSSCHNEINLDHLVQVDVENIVKKQTIDFDKICKTKSVKEITKRNKTLGNTLDKTKDKIKLAILKILYK